MTNTQAIAPATYTHALKLFAIGETATDVEKSFGSHLDAEADLVAFCYDDNLRRVEHPEGGWMLHCLDSGQVEYGAIIVAL